MLKYLFFMVWVAYMLSIGIHIFSLGFLLKRDTLPDVGKCQPIAQCSKTVGKHSTTGNCLDGDFVHNMLENHTDVTLADFCLPTKSRVIMLVVDALRYDFGVFDSNLKHPLAYQNRLPVLDELQAEHPNRVRLVRFVADPPTTTLQRIKGLTTGSLPTFIDIGSNFDTGAIHEDSIIDRVVQSGRSAVFMGDSTWSDLFPGRFKRSHSMPSFNIYDLDTVDRAVSGLLQDELRLNDWDLLIAHTLGVDHCGHKYGPLHPEMTRKLTEVDELIRYIVDAMPADSTLLVVGDHGMTRTGDHGGESPDETNALLFAYSATRPFHSDYAGTESMLQIDLVPTLAAILGVPIPFSSLGQINYNLLPQMAEDAAIVTLSRTHEFLMHTMQNVQQLRRYQIAITTRSAELFTESKIAAHAADWTHLQDVLNSAAGARRGRDSDVALRRFHADYARPFVHRVQHEFHTVWINFDPRKMTQGLLFVSLFSVLLFLLINNVPVQHFARTFSGSRAIAVGIVNVVASTLGANMYSEFGLSSPMDGWMVLGGIVNLGLIGLAVQLDFSRIVHTLRVRQVREAVSDVVWLVRIVFTFTLAVCFSNSFVVQEHYVLSYALMAVVGVLMYGVQRTHMQFDQRRRLTVGLLWRSHYVRLLAVAVVTVVLLRCSHAMFRCREEHGPLCMDGRSEVQQQTANDATVAADTAETLGQQKSKKGAAHLVDIVPVLVLAVFVGFARKIVERFGTLHGFRPAVCVARYGTVVLGVVVCVHFVLTTALTAGWTSVKATHLDQLAWVAYGVIAVQTLVLIGCPLLVFVHQNVDTRNSMQAIFRQVRDEWANGSGAGVVDAAASDMNANGRSSATADSADNLFLQIPWTEGLTGAYTSVFLLCALSGGVVVALVLGTQAASGVVLALTVAGAVLVLAATQRFQSSQTIEKCLQPDFAVLLSWTLLIHYSFYASSHQPTLAQIDWTAAFVGRQSLASAEQGGYAGMVLVLLNTFGAPALLSLLYPLLCVFGFALYAHCPQLIPKPAVLPYGRYLVNERRIQNNGHTNHFENRQHAFEVDRGELNAYEREEALLANVFRTGIQLMTLQGFRIFCSMLASTIHCRHLMVWKVFAPRFIYEGITSYVMFAAITLAFMLVMRIHLAVERLLRQIALDKTVFDRLAKVKRDAVLREAGKLPNALKADDVNEVLQKRLKQHAAERENKNKQHDD